MGRCALLEVHIDLVGRPSGGDLRAPAVAVGRDRAHTNLVDTEQRRGFSHRHLRRLSREAVARASAVERQVHATLERGLDDGPGLRGLDAAVVDAVGEHNEVAGEAVAADVRRLPGPAVLHLLADGVVERPAELGAAAVVLAVRADEEERMVDRAAGRREVKPDQVVVTLELDAAELALARRRPGEEGKEPVAAAPLGATDEEDAGVRQTDALGDEMGLQGAAERRAVDGVVRPEAAVLDQDPGVDPARGRAERLLVRP